jgi:hypothetical protein
MDFVNDISPGDLVGIKLVAESNQFAIYATGLETYLLIQRHEGMPWTGILLSGDGLFRISGLLGEATRDLYRDLAGKLSPANHELPKLVPGPGRAPSSLGPGASERRELFQDDLTEERQISPVLREIVARTLLFDPD